MNQKLKQKYQDRLDDAQKNVLESIDCLGTIHNDLTTLNGMLFEECVNGYYIPKNFSIQELVPKELYNVLNDGKGNLILWGLFDSRLLWTIDSLRMKWDTPIYINTWYGNLKNVFIEEFNLSGFRMPDTKIGAKYSQHKYGRAADLKIPAMNIEHIIQDIKQNPDDDAYKYIICVEEKVKGVTPSWLHIDIRNGKHITFISC